MSGEPPPAPDELDVDLDEDLGAFLAAWDEADREAAAILCGALGHRRGQPAPGKALAAVASRVRDGLREHHHPFAWIRSAAGLETEPFPDSDVELVLRRRCRRRRLTQRPRNGFSTRTPA